jgi:lipopolysaccharide/colanic/teichoic acid biosynthesis glycosyltransferase
MIVAPLKFETHLIRDRQTADPIQEFRNSEFKLSTDDQFTSIRLREAYRSKLTGSLNMMAVLTCRESERSNPQSNKALVDRLSVFSRTIRVTDSMGWLVTNQVAGILFTGIEPNCVESAEASIQKRLEAAGFPNIASIEFEWLDHSGATQCGVASPLQLDEVLPRIAQEQRRSERTGRQFVMATIEGPRLTSAAASRTLLRRFSGLCASWRTPLDEIGWLEHRHRVLVIIAEPELTDRTVASIEDELTSAAERCGLDPRTLLIDSYPYTYSTILEPARGTKVEKAAKRTLDALGSLAGLVILSPVLVAIAAAVKLTSPGPILFRQKRIGRHGKEFTFYKFRSMHTDTDHREHQKFVESLIAGEKPADGEYKLKNDRRITPIGGFLRKSSLDELPQLFNVLRGDMSLVGPRPPIPYEVQSYSFWHRRRLFVAHPGITGLWQVEGRSRVCFDEMVRLDLQYAASWSLWLDIRILLRTPKAVVSGNGAR